MTPDYLIQFGKDALLTAMVIAAPMLLMGLVVGVVVSILQAVTQINEMTLTFVPKMAATAIGCILFAPWMLEKIINFTVDVFTNLTMLVK